MDQREGRTAKGNRPANSMEGGSGLRQTADPVVVDAVAVTAHLVPEGGQAGVEGEVVGAVNLETTGDSHGVGRGMGEHDRPLP